tara:strand:+ start:242 stop:790 length:549 start_codon:yes stop_codon:yes gene_type:complete
MIFNTFSHYFHAIIDPSNKEELLDSIESSRLHDDQYFPWTNDCNIEVKRLDPDGIKLGPTLDEFFIEFPSTDPFMMSVRDVWQSTYTKGCFQEIHDHLPNTISGVIFLDNHQEDFSRFFFHYKHCSELTKEWREVFFPNSRYYIKGERGQVLLFPSHMMHGVTVHKSDTIRRTVAFNIQLKK